MVFFGIVLKLGDNRIKILNSIEGQLTLYIENMGSFGVSANNINAFIIAMLSAFNRFKLEANSDFSERNNPGNKIYKFIAFFFWCKLLFVK